MRITLLQASDILNISVDHLLYIANNEKRIPIQLEGDQEISYNEDGTISFNENPETTETAWWLDLNDVLEFKKQMAEGLVGEIEGILEGK